MLYNSILSITEQNTHLISLTEFKKYWIYQEQKYQDRTTALQMIGVVVWLVVVFNLLIHPSVQKSLFSYFIFGLILSTLLFFTSKSLCIKLVSKLSYFLLLSCAIEILIRNSSHNLLWTITYCSLIMVFMTSFFSDCLTYVISILIVNNVLVLPHISEIQNSVESHLMFSFWLSTLFFSVSINLMFMRERFSNYISNRKLLDMALTDSMTGIKNRRALIYAIEQALNNIPPTQSLFFLLVDVDDFKKINDQYGHKAGDIVLTEIANRIKKVATISQCGRLGGDEFGIFIIGSDEDAFNLSKRLLENISSKEIDGHLVSISIGVAKMSAGITIGQLFAEADLQMYLAKNNGKNQFSTKKLPIN